MPESEILTPIWPHNLSMSCLLSSAGAGAPWLWGDKSLEGIVCTGPITVDDDVAIMHMYVCEQTLALIDNSCHCQQKFIACYLSLILNAPHSFCMGWRATHALVCMCV